MLLSRWDRKTPPSGVDWGAHKGKRPALVVIEAQDERMRLVEDAAVRVDVCQSASSDCLLSYLHSGKDGFWTGIVPMCGRASSIP